MLAEKVPAAVTIYSAASAMDALNSRVLAQFDARGPRRSRQGLGQIPGVETFFVQKEELRTCVICPWRQSLDFSFSQRRRARRQMMDTLECAGGPDRDFLV